MDILSTMTSPSSGPIWGVIGVVLTALVTAWSNRNKNRIDANGAALTAINAGHKQLVDALFQQVKVLTEQVDTLRDHTEECERQHKEKDSLLREKDDQLRQVNARLSALERATNTG